MKFATKWRAIFVNWRKRKMQIKKFNYMQPFKCPYLTQLIYNKVLVFGDRGNFRLPDYLNWHQPRKQQNSCKGDDFAALWRSRYRWNRKIAFEPNITLIIRFDSNIPNIELSLLPGGLHVFAKETKKQHYFDMTDSNIKITVWTSMSMRFGNGLIFGANTSSCLNTESLLSAKNKANDTA